MDFIDEVRTRSSRFSQRLDRLNTEEATKTGLVMPFIQMLGYNVFDPSEVLPEFTADFGAKKGEKVDYAIMQDDLPILLIEAKKYGAPLRVEQESQLFRYFAATDTRFGILTDGIIYKFYSDLDEQKKMDSKPFFEFNMLDFTDSQVDQLKQFHKDNFNLAETIEAARELKYTNEVKRVLSEEMKGPCEPFVRFILDRIEYPGFKTKQRIEQFTPLVQSAFSNFVKDLLDARLKSALERSNEQIGGPVDAPQKPQPAPVRGPATELPLDVFCKTRSGINAMGRQEADAFILLAGSTLRKQTGPNLARTYGDLRESMLKNGQLVDDGPDLYRLTQDHRFGSSSGAAVFVMGAPWSGPRAWKDAEGRSLKELQA